ncbi:antitoxin (DNA-binding transcriptional repressor) of toxin-antitoxin stability system [Halomonas campaniensis]|uniref:Antitoxin (DNA-binding transcriptional repressor) of toxin-antitoxin stability system n=1 Tax=Halomonas campaniensis TaxID=213554 RepID=A0A7W5K5G1_9GAMM|nr:antitoxin (DNA-binding transcriptional repressor) of toxin-antitoxin stability system [Halomonas campaniensis]
MNRCRLAHGLWQLANRGHGRRFARALARPEQTQQALLQTLLLRNAETRFGIAHGFAGIRSVREFQARVPIQPPEALAPWVEAIRAGETAVLTREPVRRLVPTSGSTGPARLIPWTSRLQREFGRAVGAWTHDLFARDPALMAGPAYWSISPAGPVPEEAGGAVPIGLAADSAYLGRWLAPLVDATLAVPGAVRDLQEIEAFRYVTLLCLLRTPALRLISVWHPSFLTLLLDALPRHRERLLADIARGGLTLPEEEVPSARIAALGRRLAPLPARARALASADFTAPTSLWTGLRLVSAWADARAAEPAAELAERLPGVAFQAKGLLATEAVISLPFAGRHPLAVTSHFVEFLDDTGRARQAHEVTPGERYRPLVTTGGGLYRFDLGDLIEVTGRLGATPTLRFLGRDDRASDLCGEKLSDAFVQGVLDRLLATARGVRFAMLAPDPRPDGRPGYTLFLEAETPPTDGAARLELGLADNPHYAHARWLGQLAPAALQPVRGAQRAYLQAPQHRGRLGEIKPAALDARPGWRAVLTVVGEA